MKRSRAGKEGVEGSGVGHERDSIWPLCRNGQANSLPHFIARVPYQHPLQRMSLADDPLLHPQCVRIVALDRLEVLGKRLKTNLGTESNSMPFCYRSPRRPRRHLISLRDVERANQQVTGEMDRLGLWSSRLDDVTVWLVPASFGCYGWFLSEGDIYVPAVNGAQLSDLMFGRHTRLTDVLRHEWGHALADRRPRLVGTKRFYKVFGGEYDSPDPVREYDSNHHLTSYAATNPCEDFAETFHYYLRHKGRLPLRLQGKPAIARKWEFIARASRG